MWAPHLGSEAFEGEEEQVVEHTGQPLLHNLGVLLLTPHLHIPAPANANAMQMHSTSKITSIPLSTQTWHATATLKFGLCLTSKQT